VTDKPNGGGKAITLYQAPKKRRGPSQKPRIRRLRATTSRVAIGKALSALESRGAVRRVAEALDRLLPLAERQARKGKLALLRLIVRWHAARRSPFSADIE
jgi:hypothetical protein